jgi:hypothetical protein
MFNGFKTMLVAGVAFCGVAASVPAMAYDRHVEVVNRSSETITGFYASNVGAETWEEDILGNRVLPPGYQIRVNLDDGSGYCHFDFKTNFRDGTSVIRHNVDVCAITQYTLTP